MRDRNYINADSVRFQFNNGILEISFLQKTFVSQEILERIVSDVYELKDTSKVPVLFDMDNVLGFDYHARKFSGSKAANIHYAAIAYLVGDHVQKLLTKTILKFSPPDIEHKAFESREVATDWLRDHLLRMWPDVGL